MVVRSRPRPSGSLTALTLIACLSGSALSACTERVKPPKAEAPVVEESMAPDAGAFEAPLEEEDAGADEPTGSFDTGSVDAGVGDEGPRIGALFMVTPVMQTMEWPPAPRESGKRRTMSGNGVQRGYLRRGAIVAVKPGVTVKPNCREGWYELVDGGFVCGKHATANLDHPKLRTAASPPRRGESMPYDYGFNVANGTPLYWTIPARNERSHLEPWLRGRPKDDGDGGSEPVPWYLRSHDGGKPQVTLDELKGDGPVARRMVRGFYLSLDREFKSGNARWWKTVAGLATPFERVALYKPATSFHGIWLRADAAAASGAFRYVQDAGISNADAGTSEVLPVAANDAAPPDAGSRSDAALPVAAETVTAAATPGEGIAAAFIRGTAAKRFSVEAADSKAPRVVKGQPIGRHAGVRLTGRSVAADGARFFETTERFWVRDRDLIVPPPITRPAKVGAGEKWIDVNLKTQTLVAYEGDLAVYATLVSTGRMNEQDPTQDFRTPPGLYRIRDKHLATTMDGDVTNDGPYSIEDVPWVQYFKGSFALHGAFWHDDFGHVHSHGCVNLAPEDARNLFEWTEPRVPSNWHGVNTGDEGRGTWVHVHE
jgi:lipoprotein-anchoring transpeptidase ErfK/SrfK